MIMSRLPFSYNQVADMRTVQDPLGYADLRTTQIWTYILQRGGHSVVSRLSKLWPCYGPKTDPLWTLF